MGQIFLVGRSSFRLQNECRPEPINPRFHFLQSRPLVGETQFAAPARTERREARIQFLRDLVAVLRRGGLAVQEEIRIADAEDGERKFAGQQCFGVRLAFEETEAGSALIED